MLIGFVKESGPEEKRVSMTPSDARRLIERGHQVVCEPGAGASAGFADEAYLSAGVALVDHAEALASDLVIRISPVSRQEIDQLRPGGFLIGFFDPAREKDRLHALAERQITALSLDSIPRTSRAQSMDVLSSMAQLTGYRAVIEGSVHLPRMLGGQITAAGKSNPARVLVIGAGVAGLAAIAAARSLGALVTAFDTRSEAIEQVKSLGAKSLRLPEEFSVADRRSDGYAEEASAALLRAEQDLFLSLAAECDLVITTAVVPGQKAPLLLTEEFLQRLQHGSVIVDLAASSGGNCCCTVPGEIFRTDRGVTVVGYTNFPSRMAMQASQLFSGNLTRLLLLLEGDRAEAPPLLRLEETLLRAMTVTHEGLVLWPPPVVAVQQALSQKGSSLRQTDAKEESKEVKEMAASTQAAWVWAGLFLCLGIGAGIHASSALLTQLTIFGLACLTGYYTVHGVTHALHTPLMSVTNAISGIIIVGALLQLESSLAVVKYTSLVALFVSSINILGGFSVTHRMLKMFQGNRSS